MTITPTLDRRDFLKRALPNFPSKSIYNAAGLEPYSPSPDQPWDRRRAAHLARRASFGAPLNQIETLLTLTPDAAVDALVDEAINMPVPELPDWASIPPPPFEAPQAEKDAFSAANQENKLSYRAGWVESMRTAGLRDKMALFWSNHFVTQVGGYGLGPYMAQYLTLLRTHALGNLKSLTYDIGLLPAMLLYLNGHQNHKNGPNENYARELCELFTMGIADLSGQPNYSQAEITELARALTGWRQDRQQLASYFEPNRFDDGEKTFFGRTGNFGYGDVIDIIFEERTDSIAHFCCRKLYRFFVYAEPDETIVAEMASLLISENFEVTPVLRTLLKSAHFFDDSVIGAKIKSPMEYLGGLINEIGAAIPAPDGNITLFRYGVQLSQSLFDPPNVAGWTEDHAWLSTGTMPLRWTYGSNLINGNFVFEAIDPIPLAKLMSDPNDPYALSRELAEYMLAQPLAEEDAAALVEILLDGTPDYEWSIDEMIAPNRLRGFLSYLVQLPEYQLA